MTVRSDRQVKIGDGFSRSGLRSIPKICGNTANDKYFEPLFDPGFSVFGKRPLPKAACSAIPSNYDARRANPIEKFVANEYTMRPSFLRKIAALSEWKFLSNVRLYLFLLVVVSLLLTKYKDTVYYGIVHDARIYASDIARIDENVGNDLLAMSPQKSGSLFAVVLHPFYGHFSIEALFRAVFLVAVLLEFWGYLALLRAITPLGRISSLWIAAVFSLVPWEVLTTVIRVNEPFLTARTIQIGLTLLAFAVGFGNRTSEKGSPARALFGGLLYGLAFCFHPVESLYAGFFAFLLPRNRKWFFIGTAGFVACCFMVTSGAAAQMFSGGKSAWTASAVSFVRANKYLFMTQWNIHSIDKILNQVILLAVLGIWFRKSVVGKICLTCFFFGGICIAVYNVLDILYVHVPLLVWLQPLRVAWVFDVLCFLALAVWIFEPGQTYLSKRCRIALFGLYLLTGARLSPVTTILVLLFTAVEQYGMYVIRGQKFTTARYLAFAVVLVLIADGASSEIYRCGIVYQKWHLTLVPLVAAFLLLPRTVVLPVYLIATVFLTVGEHRQEKKARWFMQTDPGLIRALAQHIPTGSTVAFAGSGLSFAQDFSGIRYLVPGIGLYYNLLDKGPSCYSASYTAEVIRRKFVSKKMAIISSNKEYLLRMCRNEKIDYIVAPRDIDLPCTFRAGKLRLYAVGPGTD